MNKKAVITIGAETMIPVIPSGMPWLASGTEDITRSRSQAIIGTMTIPRISQDHE